MKGLDNQLYITLLVISNLVAILQLIAAFKWTRIARLSFFLLFLWASFANWKTVLSTPGFYLEYADLTWSRWYSNFILGWFASHIQLVVGAVATAQALIAISMLLKGWAFKTGSIGGMIFLIAILPLGVGSGFPCTAIMAFALFILFRKEDGKFLWPRTTGIATSKGYQ